MNQTELTIHFTDDPQPISRREAFALLRRVEALEESLMQGGITLLENFLNCQTCGQRDTGQTGEYPCQTCGVPTVHDEGTEGK